MNNDAFKSLCENVPPKSSKEIAREAVEQEFRQQRKRKRRRGAGGSSDEDDDDDDSDVDDDQKQEEDDKQKQKELEGTAAARKGAVKGAGKKEKAVSSTAIEPGTAGR
jgi:hypothetical protein